ncbi:MAG: hypothetical protein AB9835_07510 [Eubacteriales bacterium]
MSNYVTLKETPFGYKTSKDLFDKHVAVNFSKLTIAATLYDFYNFIFSAGSLRYWIIHEYNLTTTQENEYFWDDDNFIIFNTIYNNSKHYKLTSKKNQIPRLYVIQDGVYLGKPDENGVIIWDDDKPWDDNADWVEQVNGESGGSEFYIITKDQDNQTQAIHLFDVCKKIYNRYIDIFTRLHNT